MSRGSSPLGSLCRIALATAIYVVASSGAARAAPVDELRQWCASAPFGEQDVKVQVRRIAGTRADGLYLVTAQRKRYVVALSPDQDLDSCSWAVLARPKPPNRLRAAFAKGAPELEAWSLQLRGAGSGQGALLFWQGKKLVTAQPTACGADSKLKVVRLFDDGQPTLRVVCRRTVGAGDYEVSADYYHFDAKRQVRRVLSANLGFSYVDGDGCRVMAGGWVKILKTGSAPTVRIATPTRPGRRGSVAEWVYEAKKRGFVRRSKPRPAGFDPPRRCPKKKKS